MKKTSLYLPDDLDAALARRAADDGLSKAELIRRTLEGAMQRPSRPKPTFGAFDSVEDRTFEQGADAELRGSGFGE